MIRPPSLALPLALLVAAAPAAADNLWRGPGFVGLAADRRASAPGDILTVLVFQAAEATNSAQTSTRRNTEIGGSIGVDSIDESLELQFGRNSVGRGEARRAERLVARLSVNVVDIFPNGDLAVVGEQWMRVNGETSRIGVRGRIRQADISADNTILSSRIADAQIDYNGRGFVSRSARPGLINRIFSFLGL